MNDTKGYVFISYSTKNQADADSVRKILTENGIKTWMAPYDIPTGKSYMEVITPAIENSSIFLLLLTEEAEKSPWVPDELSIAKTSMPGRILPISRGTMPKGVLKLPLQTVQIQMVHNIQQNDQGMRAVVQRIKTRLSAIRSF